MIKSLNILKNIEFLKLWIGYIFSSLGDAMVQISLMAITIEMSSKAGPEIAKIIFFFLLSAFLIGAPAGAISDKFSRKWIMISSNFYRAALVLIIPIVIYHNSIKGNHNIVEPIIYLFSFLSGIGATFFYPPKQSVIPNLVKAEHLQFANALNAGTAMIALLIGTVFSGYYISHYGIKSMFLINTAIYIVGGLIIASMIANKGLNNSSYKVKQNLIEDFTFTIDYLKTHRKILSLIILSISLNLIISLFFNSLNALAADYFKIGIGGLSQLKGMLGVGMIVGVPITIHLNKHLRIPFLFTSAYALLFITTVTAKIVTNYQLAWIWLIATGISAAMLSITIDTLMQKVIPDRLRGKVFGFCSMIITFIFLSATLFVSECLNVTTPYFIFRLIAGICLITAITILYFDKKFLYYILKRII